jgi:hypothetical protein
MKIFDTDALTELAEKVFGTIETDQEYTFFVNNDGSVPIDNVSVTIGEEASCLVYNPSVLNVLENPEVEIENSGFLRRVGWVELNYQNKTGKAIAKDIRNSPRTEFYVDMPTSEMTEWQVHVIDGLKIKFRRYESISDTIIDMGIWVSDCWNFILLATYSSGTNSEFVPSVSLGTIAAGASAGFTIKIPAYYQYIDSVFNPHRFKIKVTERSGKTVSIPITFTAKNRRIVMGDIIAIEDLENMPWTTTGGYM